MPAEFWLWIGVLLASLFGLVKASGFMNRSAERIGLALGVSPFVVGVVLLAVGTSLPELLTSILAVVEGHAEIILGNVIGSNITNIFLILGVVGVLQKGALHFNPGNIGTDLFFLVGSLLFFGYTLMDGHLSRIEGALLVGGFGLYLYYAVKESSSLVEFESVEVKTEKARALDYAIFFASGGVLYFGADYTVLSVIQISAAVGIGTEVIATTAIALGTSLPELVVSVDAVRKNQPEMALGNVLGSCIFNLFFVAGVGALITPLAVSAPLLNSVFPLLLIATLLAFFIIREKRISRYESLLLLLFYVYFLAHVIQLV